MKKIIIPMTILLMASCSNQEIAIKSEAPKLQEKFFGVWSQLNTEKCPIGQNEKNEMWMYPNGVFKRYIKTKEKTESYIGTWETSEAKHELIYKMIEEWDTSKNFIETTYDLNKAFNGENLNLFYIKARFFEKATNSYLVTPFKNVETCEFQKRAAIEK